MKIFMTANHFLRVSGKNMSNISNNSKLGDIIHIFFGLVQQCDCNGRLRKYGVYGNHDALKTLFIIYW